MIKVLALSDNYRSIKVDMSNIEETNEGPYRSKRLPFSLQSSLGYEYKTNMFHHCLPIHSISKSRKENPQKLTQLSSRSHPRHLVGKRTAQKDITIDTTSDSQVNSNFPNRWSPASLTFNNYFYPYFYIYI